MPVDDLIAKLILGACGIGFAFYCQLRAGWYVGRGNYSEATLAALSSVNLTIIVAAFVFR